MLGRAGILLLLSLPLAGEAHAGPRADFLLHCAGCHLPDASGVAPIVPPLRETLGRIMSTPAGRDYVVRVPGASQTPLTDDALAAVMNWLLETYSQDTLPADFEPLTGREVGRSRKQVLADPLKLRQSLWPDY